MGLHDLERRWGHLLTGLEHAGRVAVLKALQNSEDTGYPATAEGVQLLVAFARGHLSARQYSARILVALGFGSPTPAPVRTTATSSPWSSGWGDDSLQMPTLQRRPSEPARRTSGASVPAVASVDALRHGKRSQRVSSHDTVQMYLSGQIPMEEFLRRQQGRTSV